VALLLCSLFSLPDLVEQMRTVNSCFSGGFDPYLDTLNFSGVTYELQACRDIMGLGLKVDGT